MVADMAMAYAGHAVVVRVLRQATVIETPGEVVHRILFAFDGLGHDLRKKRVVEEAVEVAFDRDRLEKEAFVVFLARGRAHQDDFANLIHAWSTGTTHHGDEIRDGVVRRTHGGALELLGTQHYHEGSTSGRCGRPTEPRRADAHLGGAGGKKETDGPCFTGRGAFREDSNTVPEGVGEGMVYDEFFDDGLDPFLFFLFFR
mmetsp:Transcript_3715/g.6442  ORF Transcript_3715/g.6442 Transcript_3715/m.6442 type:complete len:201 (-) Transcript_3715:239-841(-)